VMDKIEKNGPGCYVWMRFFTREDELESFLADCGISRIGLISLSMLRIKELEQDATQESSKGSIQETKAESS